MVNEVKFRDAPVPAVFGHLPGAEGRTRTPQTSPSRPNPRFSRELYYLLRFFKSLIAGIIPNSGRAGRLNELLSLQVLVYYAHKSEGAQEGPRTFQGTDLILTRNFTEGGHLMHPTSLTRVWLTVMLALGLIWGLGGGLISKAGAAEVLTPVAEPIAFERAGWLYYSVPAEKQPRKLVKGHLPALSPDDKKLVYVPLEEDGTVGYGLMQLDLGTGQSTTLVPPGKVREGDPAWSPQGDLLAFIDDMKEIMLIKADGSGKRKIFSVVPGAPLVFSPAWAPDGQSLFFHDLFNLFQIDRNGRVLAKTPLTIFTGREEAVTSTDRFVPNPREPQLFTFTMSVEGTPKFTQTFNELNTALFLYDTRTQKRFRLTPPDMLALSPCWSRDGNLIYFCGYREPNYREKYPFRIYRINRDGTGLTMLAMGENPNVSLAGHGQPLQKESPGQAESPPPAAQGSEALPPPPPMPD